MAPLFWISFILFYLHAGAVMTNVARIALLRDHNDRRMAVGATNMIKLQYDFILEKVAQAYIDTCPSPNSFSHNPKRTSQYLAAGGQNAGDIQYVGENWYSGAPYNSTPQENLFGGATGAWTDNTCSYWVGSGSPMVYSCGGQQCSEAQSFYQTNGCTQSGDYGHFTQVMWAKTAYVGCGYNPKCGTLCDYAPGGNFNLPPNPIPSSAIWGTSGSACSNCPANYSHCGSDGLCVAISPSVAQCPSLPSNNIPNGDMGATCSPYTDGSVCSPVVCSKGPLYKVKLTCSGTEWKVTGGGCEAQGLGNGAVAAGVLLPVSIIILAALIIGFRERIGAKLREYLPGPGVLLNSIVLTLMVIPFLLLCISAGTVYWSTDSTIETGLFKLCYSGSNCQDMSSQLYDDDQSLLKATQAFILVALVILVPPTVIVILFWAEVISHDHRIATTAYVCILTSLVCSYIGFILYAAFYNDFFAPATDLKINWSFGLAVIAAGILVFSSVFTYHYSHSQSVPRAGVSTETTKWQPVSPSKVTEEASSATLASPSKVPMSPTQEPSSPTPFSPNSPDWEKHWDENQKAHYWYNSKSGETQWDQP